MKSHLNPSVPVHDRRILVQEGHRVILFPGCTSLKEPPQRVQHCLPPLGQKLQIFSSATPHLRSDTYAGRLQHDLAIVTELIIEYTDARATDEAMGRRREACMRAAAQTETHHRTKRVEHNEPDSKSQIQATHPSDLSYSYNKQMQS